jgi:hypothetical protein
MPRNPIDWSRCIIYKIFKDDMFYVGSTTHYIERKANHKYSCNNKNAVGYNLKVYQLIRENGGWDNWEMIEIEEYKECKNKIQSRIREEEWRIKLNALLNDRKAINTYTRAEKYYHKLEKNPNFNQEHHQKYKDKIKERKREKYTCNCGSLLCKAEKARHERSQKHLSYINICQ